MTRARAFLRSSRTRTVLGVMACWLGFQLWLTVAAPGKISLDLSRASGRVNVQIDLPFTPERFHVLAVQRYGRIAGADEHSIELRGVRTGDLTSLARPFWVRKVEPLRED